MYTVLIGEQVTAVDVYWIFPRFLCSEIALDEDVCLSSSSGHSRRENNCFCVHLHSSKVVGSRGRDLTQSARFSAVRRGPWQKFGSLVHVYLTSNLVGEPG